MADNTKDCDDLKFYASANQVGGVKLNQGCATTPIKVPEELREPKGVTTTTTPLQSPRPIQVSNLEVTVTCAELYYNTEGNNVTVPAKEFTALVSLNTIAGVNDSVLHYIASTRLEDEIEAQLESRTLTAESLVTLTGLTFTQAQTFISLAESQQSTLDLSARTLALSRLKCYWWNTEQEAECPDPLMATSNEFSLAQYRVIVAQHTVSSDISQEDADAKALTQAKTQLNCLYISDAFTAKCTTRDSRPYPITEHVPNDTSPVAEGLSERVGTFSVPAGTFISFDSKEDANAQAEAYAWSQLNCYYVNDLVERHCTDPRARNRGVDPTLYPAVDANIVARTAGQQVVIPVGFFTSDLSTADATQQAITLADMLLECCYLNEPITITCPPDEDGNPASSKGSSVYSISVPRGAFISCESQEAANAEALASIQQELQCVYCNSTVVPTCVPNWVVEAATTGILLTKDMVIQGEEWYEGELYKLKMPFSSEGLVNPYTGEPENVADWSEDATVGIEADAICSETKKQEAQDIAETIAQVKVKSPKEENDGENCHYASPKILLGCSFIDPYLHDDKCTTKHLTKDSEHGSFVLYDTVSESAINLNNDPEEPISYRKTKDGEPYIVVQLANGTCHSVEVSSPSDFGYLEIEAGTIIMTPAEVPWLDTTGLTPDEMRAATMDYMEQLLIALFLPSVQCKYINPTMAVACSWTRKISSGCATQYVSVKDNDVYSVTAQQIENWVEQDSLALLTQSGLRADISAKNNLWPAKDNKAQQKRYIAKVMAKQYSAWEATSDCTIPEITEFADPKAKYWWYGASKPKAWDTRLVEGAPTRETPIIIKQGTFEGLDYNTVLHDTLAFAYSLLQGKCKYFNKEVIARRRCACGGGHTKRTHLITGTAWDVEVKVPRGVVQADSPAEADAIAREMADIKAAGRCPCLYGNEPFYCDCWAYLRALAWSGKGKWETPPTPEMLEDMIDKQFYLPADTFVSEDPWEIEALLDEQLAENCATLVCKLHAQWMWWSSGKVKCKCCCNNWLTTEPTFCGPLVIDEKTGKCIELTFNKGAYTGSQKKMPLRVQEACIEQCMLLTYLARTAKAPYASFQVIVNLNSDGNYCYEVADGNVRLPGGRVIKLMYQKFFCTKNGKPLDGEITMQIKKLSNGNYNIYYVALDPQGKELEKVLVYPYPV